MAVRELQIGETGLAHRALAELRPSWAGRDEFVRRVDEVQRPEGYRLFASFDEEAGPSDDAAAVAGFRRIKNLAWGDVLYIDDLSTREGRRRQGHGQALLDAVNKEAAQLGCDAVHLDSGHQRHEAHRLYLDAGYRITSHHFVFSLDDD